jgi:hypothetical protein
MNNGHEYFVVDEELIKFKVRYHMALLSDNNLLQLNNDIYVNPKYISEIKEIIIDNNHDFVLNAD